MPYLFFLKKYDLFTAEWRLSSGAVFQAICQVLPKLFAATIRNLNGLPSKGSFVAFTSAHAMS